MAADVLAACEPQFWHQAATGLGLDVSDGNMGEGELIFLRMHVGSSQPDWFTRSVVRGAAALEVDAASEAYVSGLIEAREPSTPVERLAEIVAVGNRSQRWLASRNPSLSSESRFEEIDDDSAEEFAIRAAASNAYFSWDQYVLRTWLVSELDLEELETLAEPFGDQVLETQGALELLDDPAYISKCHELIDGLDYEERHDQNLSNFRVDFQ